MATLNGKGRRGMLNRGRKQGPPGWTGLDRPVGPGSFSELSGATSHS